MNLAQLSALLCLPQDTSNSVAFTTSLLSRALLSAEPVPFSNYIPIRTSGDPYITTRTSGENNTNNTSIDPSTTTPTFDNSSDTFLVGPYATTLPYNHNNNNNNNRLHTVYNAFAVAIHAAFATNHDRLLDPG